MRPLLLSALGLLLATPAPADPAADPLPSSFELAGLPLALPAHPLLRVDPARLPDSTQAAPVRRSASAHAPGIAWLGVFADGATYFTVPHDGVELDVRGGAYLQLLHNLSFRGSYRIFDYDQKASDGSFDFRDQGPLFGLRLRF
jgi:hypothetical protein